MPTLSELAVVNPNLEVLTNHSANFDTSGVIERAGFTKLTRLEERIPRPLSRDTYVIRYPCTGIDNMLLMRFGPWKILNYNDCNIPAYALRKLCRRFGHIDVVLLNFNHAGKLVKGEQIPPEEIKRNLITTFRKKVKIIGAQHVVPFASMHRYLSPHSQYHNQSLLTCEEVSQIPEAHHVTIGGSIAFDRDAPPVVTTGEGVSMARTEPIHYAPPHPIEELVSKAEIWRHRLHKEFFGLVAWLDPVRIHVVDIDHTLILDIRRGASSTPGGTNVHISSHSAALARWFDKKYGTVDFHVGAHYTWIGNDTSPLLKLFLAAGLFENTLSPRSALQLGWRFFLNRREEIMGIILGWRFTIKSRF
jgi:hypothetical protein